VVGTSLGICTSGRATATELFKAGTLIIESQQEARMS